MFGIASPTALKKYQADAGTVDATGVFHPTGTFATQNPIGTGAYIFQSWTVGSKLTLVRNPHYWGRRRSSPGSSSCRSVNGSAARLQALQSGEVQAFDDVDPDTVRPDHRQVQALQAPAVHRRLHRHQPVDPADEQPARPPGAGVRDQQGAGRQGVLRRSRRAATPVHPAVAVRLRQEGRAGVSVQPGQVEAAAPAGGPEAARQGRLLVSDERLPAVHAEPCEQLPGVLCRPRQGRIRRRRRTRRRGGPTTGRASRAARTSCSCSVGSPTSPIRPTS